MEIICCYHYFAIILPHFLLHQYFLSRLLMFLESSLLGNFIDFHCFSYLPKKMRTPGLFLKIWFRNSTRTWCQNSDYTLTLGFEELDRQVAICYTLCLIWKKKLVKRFFISQKPFLRVSRNSCVQNLFEDESFTDLTTDLLLATINLGKGELVVAEMWSLKRTELYSKDWLIWYPLSFSSFHVLFLRQSTFFNTKVKYLESSVFNTAGTSCELNLVDDLIIVRLVHFFIMKKLLGNSGTWLREKT